MKLVIIGGGNMGGAIVRGVIAQRVLPPREMVVVEVDAAKRAMFAEMGCGVMADAGEVRAVLEERQKATDGADERADATDEREKGGRGNPAQVMLAVKPQMFAEVAAALTPITTPRVFASIMAGLESSKIHHALGPAARIVRCMPNVACQIGKGTTAISLGMGAREGDEDLARQIFDALGKTVMLDERLLHAVTAVSASGLAYVFQLAEAMQKAAEQVDLPPDIAKMLVTQTMVGAAAMLEQKGSDAAALRRSVTSPRGTTEAALRVFEKAGFEKIVIDAIRAARDRGVELNQSPP